MELRGLIVSEFVESVSSDSPAPGGGSVSALAGSVGAALTCMVSELTIGREKYKEHEELMQDINADMSKIKSKLVLAIDRDKEAFDGVTDVFRMPKETDEEKDKRKVAMQKALKDSVIVPIEVMEMALEGLLITEKALGKSNTNAASDLGVGALNLKSCIQGAWLNVLINLSGIKDEKFVNEYKEKGNEILKKALPIADKIYNEILKDISC